MTKVTKVQFEELRRNLQEDRNQGQCPVWPGYSTGASQTGAVKAPGQLSPLHGGHFWSPRAGGVFVVPDGVIGLPAQVADEEIKKRISSWIWERNAAFGMLREEEEGEIPELTTASIREVARRPALKTEQRIDRALRAIGRPPKGIRQSIEQRMDDRRELSIEQRIDGPQGLFMAATECGSWPEMEWFTSELVRAGLIDREPEDFHGSQFLLTLKGLSRLETGGAALVSNTAFVAMWFDPEVNDAYGTGIEPAIREAGYEPVRIDLQEHADRIDDRIIAEIRRARFLVCDFTCGLLPDGGAESGNTAVARGGVYYEAGFAHGLGKRVIWTCRRDLIDHVHFDLRQYNCILWEKGKEDELRKALHNRIRAVIT